MLRQVLCILLLLLCVFIEADSVEAGLVKDYIKAAIGVSHIEEVHLLVDNTRNVAFVHSGDDFGHKVAAGNVFLVHDGA